MHYSEGIFHVDAFEDRIKDRFRNGPDKGHGVGIPSIDDLYRVRLGEFSVVTGIPSHGKSTYVEWMLMQFAVDLGWKFALFSPESYPLERHVLKLAEMYTGTTFQGHHNRMGEDHLADAVDFIRKHFFFLYPPEDRTTLSDLLDMAQELKDVEDIQGFVIDPWNEIEHRRPQGQNEVDYLGLSLSRIRRFGRANEMHMWIIAHPRLLQKDKDGGYPIPTPYDINGGAMWRNKADHCMCVYRPNINGSDVQIHVQKIKTRDTGQPGVAGLTHDYLTGRYYEGK